MKETLGTFAVGTTMGVVLSRIGFASWDEVHRMFVFASFRMLGAFMLTVALLAIGWWIVRKLATRPLGWTTRPVHPGSVAGGLIFGAGWALSGACPSIALVQLGGGQLGALFTLAGILVGNWLYAVVHERYFRWTQGSCLTA